MDDKLVSFTAGESCQQPEKWNYKLVPSESSTPVFKLTTATQNECEEKCLQHTQFRCAAYNYYYYSGYSGNCELVPASNIPPTEQYNYYWRYYTMPACASK